MEIQWRLPVDAYGTVDWQTLGHGAFEITQGGLVNRLVRIAIGVLAMSQAASGTASADEPLGQPVVTTTFGLGAGPMPDVATDPSTHRAYVTSQGDDSLYVADPTSGVATIKVGPAPGFVAVDPATQTAYVTIGNSVFGSRHRNRIDHRHHPGR